MRRRSDAARDGTRRIEMDPRRGAVFPINDRISPTVLLTWSFGLWLGVLILLPVSPVVPDGLDPYLLLVGSVLGLYLGLMLPVFDPIRSKPANIDDDLVRYGFRISFALGIVGLTARVIDWTFVRQIETGGSIFDNRAIIEAAGPNLLGAVAATLIPFTVAAASIAIWSRARGTHLPHSWLAYPTAIVWPLMAAVLGSRSSMVLVAGMIAVSVMLTAPRINGRFLMYAVAGTVVLLAVSFLILEMRVGESGVTLGFVAQYAAYTELVPLDPWVVSIINSSPPLIADSVFFLTHIGQYLVHGVFEFLHLASIEGVGQLSGSYEFFMFQKLFDVFGGQTTNVAQVFDNPLYRSGVFTTIFGPAYLDFGWFAPLFVFGFGLLTRLVRRAVLTGDPFAFPLYAVLLIQIALAPIVSGLLLGAGMFYNLVLLGFWIVMTMLRSSRSKFS